MFDSIIVLGPTATGKTSLAIKLANALSSEIVNADSMYIYKYFDIGTAKPNTKELSEAKHHLIGFLEPTECYSVANFRIDACKVIKEIWSKKMTPIIVGGTGFYIDSLIKSFSYGSVEKDVNLRNGLEAELSQFGNDYLY